MHRHPNDLLCILEEGSNPLPKCELCGMHIPFTALNGNHRNTKACAIGARIRRQRNSIEDTRQAREVLFTACGVPLESVSSFKYLGRILTSTDDDWPALYKNLAKARKRWGMVSRVLARDGANERAMAMFYKAVVQSVLLFGSETWVITDRMMDALRGFHHRAARRITGMVAYRVADGWDSLPIEAVLEVAGLYPIEVYLERRQNTLVDYNSTRPIFDLCNDASRLSGSPNRKYWWQTRL